MEPLRAFDWNGRIVRYRERGEGEPIVFLHNGGSDHRIWDFQVAELSRDFRAIAIDLPGFGTSHRPDEPYDLDFYRAFLDDFLDSLGEPRVTLVGNCIGAAIALDFARREPERVRALVLFNVLAGRKMIRWASGIDLPAVEATRIYLVGLGRLLRRSRFARERVASGLFGKRRPTHTDEVFGHLVELAGRPEQIRSRWNLIRGLDSYARSAEGERGILPPTLLFWGRGNSILPESVGRRFAAWLRPDRAVWVDYAGHLAMVEAPAEVNREIAEFVRAH